MGVMPTCICGTVRKSRGRCRWPGRPSQPAGTTRQPSPSSPPGLANPVAKRSAQSCMQRSGAPSCCDARGDLTVSEAVFSVQRAPIYTESDRKHIQLRTIVVLIASQTAGGFGLVATYIVSALLAQDITGSATLGTIAASCLSIGSAVVAVPMSRLMNRYGRRPGLRFGYLVGAAGATAAVLGAILVNYPLLCLGVFGAGAGNAANLATRYAASDLAPEHRRAMMISLIVLATTFGSATGSGMSGITSYVGVSLGLPDKTGAYVVAGIMFLVAAAIVELFLRPDPMHVAEDLANSAQLAANAGPAQPAPSTREAVSLIWQKPEARLAVFAMVVSQLTMVGVMALTPLHMDAGGQSQSAIGMMMAVHIFGMYLFSPLVGILTDRIGSYPMLYIAGGFCTWGAWWAAVTPPEGVLGVFMGNFLVGLGWCFGVVAGSNLMVALYPLHQRVAVQGVGDFAMLGSGAAAGLSSGALYTIFQYSGVNYANAAFGLALILATFFTYTGVQRAMRRPHHQQPATAVGG
ncbi:MAG: MFS transporter [Acidimicrobiales bacterium]|nr:MFS transporter [Acidimicrobiales bacterium]MYH73430.1 MFS transporter [Acidimicrobiales bacterium]MYK72755.1 MFS transporter [Acidimicrobiales bacterium]